MDHDRLTYLFGPEALELVEGYDLDDESDRMALVDEYLALPPDVPSRAARMAVRSVAVAQIVGDDPPELWQTVERLRDLAHDREDVLSQVSMVIGEHLSLALASKSEFDRSAYVGALGELPLPTAPVIARVAVDAVRAHQGISIDEHIDAIVEAVSRRGGQIVETMVDHVLDDLIEGPLMWLPDDTTVHVPDLVDGRTFTHRFTDAEAELGVLTAGFDLGAFARFDSVRSADGTELDQFSVERDHLAWRGPDGWLGQFVPGDLLSIKATVDAPDGGVGEPVDAVVTIEMITNEPDVTDEAVSAVRAGYDEYVAEPGLPVSGEDLAIWLCFHHSELFTLAQPPLDELCAAAGLTRRGGQVAHDEAVWRHALWARRFHEASALVPESEWRRVLGRALDVLDDPEASVDDVRGALDECAEPEVLDALADVLIPHYLDADDEFELEGADAPGRLFDLVHRAVAVARRPRETATAQYLACVLHERSGAPETAQEHLDAAASAQPRLGPVAERMGWYRYDRGDARGAVKWWRTLSELPPAADIIEPFVGPTRHQKLGRNEPCWCGSGRKYKQCHQNSTELPALPDRVAWLCRKATTWLEHATGDPRDVVVEMAIARAAADADAGPSMLRHLDDDVVAERFSDGLADPIVFDTALHEGDLWQLFLRERGPLLPDDEQLLAASWLTVDRSVHEVVALERGVELTLRNVATGDIAEVRERTLSHDAKVGELYCARIVPDGATNQIIGGVFRVRTGTESTVLDLCADGDGAAVCAWVGALHQPPRIVHTPGMLDSMIDREALEAATADLDGADEAAVLDRLDAELGRQMQAAWLDEHIPALDGLTPREAAADPTRREQLERLLSELDRMAERAAAASGDDLRLSVYDATQLRHELGLD